MRVHVVRGIEDRGFTLLELLVAMAVAAVLVTVAIPSYRGLVSRNAMAAQVNDLVGDLQYARSQAVTRGQRVYLCKSSDQKTCLCKSSNEKTCADAGDWSQGWIVFAPNPDDGNAAPTSDNLLRVHGALDDQIQITGNSHVDDKISFDANGFASNSNGTLTAKAPSAADTRIVIARSGRLRTESGNGS
jgi:type IV fimbrial biogenesis protein FimT